MLTRFFYLRRFGKVEIFMRRFYNKITIIKMSIAQRDMMYKVNKVTQISLLTLNICQQRKGWARNKDVVVTEVQC
jgi:hypothetical protein